MKVQWESQDVVEIGKTIGKNVNDSEAYDILKNVAKAHGRISKALILNGIDEYYRQ